MRNFRVARNHLWNFSSLLFSNQAYIMGVRKRSTCGIDKWYNNKLLTRNIILMQKRKISTRSLRSLAGATNQRNYFKRNSWNYDNEFFRASDLRNNLNLLTPPPCKTHVHQLYWQNIWLTNKIFRSWRIEYVEEGTNRKCRLDRSACS